MKLLLSSIFWLILWQIAAAVTNSELIIASPVSVVRHLLALVTQPAFITDALTSFVRITGGFLLGLSSGFVLAVAAKFVPFLRTLLAPLITVLKTVPVAAVVILALVWFGNEGLTAFVTVSISLPLVYTNILTGLDKADVPLLEMSRVLRKPRLWKFRYIYFYSAAPFLQAAAKTAVGMCWKAGTAAEVIGLPAHSIGERMYMAKLYIETADLLAITVVIILLSVVFEKAFGGVLNTVIKKAVLR